MKIGRGPTRSPARRAIRSVDVGAVRGGVAPCATATRCLFIARQLPSRRVTSGESSLCETPRGGGMRMCRRSTWPRSWVVEATRGRPVEDRRPEQMQSAVTGIEAAAWLDPAHPLEQASAGFSSARRSTLKKLFTASRSGTARARRAGRRCGRRRRATGKSAHVLGLDDREHLLLPVVAVHGRAGVDDPGSAPRITIVLTGRNRSPAGAGKLGWPGIWSHELWRGGRNVGAPSEVLHRDRQLSGLTVTSEQELGSSRERVILGSPPL